MIRFAMIIACHDSPLSWREKEIFSENSSSVFPKRCFGRELGAGSPISSGSLYTADDNPALPGRKSPL
jgi:hypothetical protein